MRTMKNQQRQGIIIPDFDGFNPIEKSNNLIISDICFLVNM